MPNFIYFFMFTAMKLFAMQNGIENYLNEIKNHAESHKIGITPFCSPKEEIILTSGSNIDFEKIKNAICDDGSYVVYLRPALSTEHSGTGKYLVIEYAFAIDNTILANLSVQIRIDHNRPMAINFRHATKTDSMDLRRGLMTSIPGHTHQNADGTLSIWNLGIPCFIERVTEWSASSGPTDMGNFFSEDKLRVDKEHKIVHLSINQKLPLRKK
jgi:hypothetical protein